MKQFIGILLFVFLLTGISSCYTTTIPKPDKLIPKEKFINMMVDLYVVQGLNTTYDIKDSIKKFNQTDLYYSILNKYSVADTIFVRSLNYYASFPRDYEKMHLQIVDNLKASEQLYKPKEKLNTDTE
ncbi:MAG: DUF4296 domain-containing protein [Prolixibacteraceae bacterium]